MPGSRMLALVVSTLLYIPLPLSVMPEATEDPTPQLGPSFSHEPPHQVEFTNTSGTHVQCSAVGHPTPGVTWVTMDGKPASSIAGLRDVTPDGTLTFPPFKAENFRQDVHETIYRCIASNPIGTIVSRDVRVRAVVLRNYDVHVYDVFVIAGNTAVLKCLVPSHLSRYIRVTSWVRDDRKTQAETLIPKKNGRYMILPGGDLHIQNVHKNDGNAAFSCHVEHRLTKEKKISLSSGKMYVSEAMGSVPPRIEDAPGNVQVRQGETAVLPCVAQGYPVPNAIWFGKFINGQLLPIHIGEHVQQTKSALIIESMQPSYSTTYVCTVSNGIGNATQETVLTVAAPLMVHVEPKRLVGEIGKSAVFRCSISGFPVPSVTWLKNGRPLAATEDVLSLEALQLEDRGMYQCIVKNSLDSTQASAEVLFGVPGAVNDIRALAASADSVLVSWQPPTQPNGVIEKYFVFVQLVTGNNDGQEKAKYSVDGNTTVYEVIGLKESNRYQFWVTAVNARGEGLKSKVVIQSPKTGNVGARVASFGNVIRTTTKNDIRLPCRVAGVPLPDRKWVIRGELLSQSDPIRVLTDGALLLRDVQKTDAGNYTCYVDNGYGDDSVTYVVVILGIPTRPVVDVLLATATTIDIHWKGVQDSGSPVFRHILHYRHESDVWNTIEVEPKEDSCQLKNLICGTEYEVYVVSENKIGKSEPSTTITARTKGSVPEQPLKEKLLEESNSSVTVHLETWKSAICPIHHFAVEYSARSRDSWITSSDNVKPEQRTLVIRDLHPATHYKIRVTAHNDAGTTKAEYEITTLTATEGTIAPFSPVVVKKPGLLVPIGISLAVFLLLLMLICCFIRFLRSPPKH